MSPSPGHRLATAVGDSVNTQDDTLSEPMKSMSLSSAATTSLPPSSPFDPLPQRQEIPAHGSPSSSNRGAHALLRRAPSSSSLSGPERYSSPALNRKTSRNSLHEIQSRTPPSSPAIRRTSSYMASTPKPTVNGRPSLPPPAEEVAKPPLTAGDIARDFLKQDLDVNHGQANTTRNSRALVILQDDCYGHRYARPRTSKAGLSTIVERPERIHAALMGVATAYIRLGGRHANGDAAPHPHRTPSSLPDIPFRIHKTARKLSLRSPAATAVHGLQWMNDLSMMCDTAESKLAMGSKELSRPPNLDQANAIASEKKPTLHEGDLYLCSGSLDALEGALGGVCEAVDSVFSDKGSKRAFVCIRPPGHHCSAEMPSGFCWLNNVHVGISHASTAHGLTHAAIIDFDLHHGDGSQSITWAHNARMASMPKSTPMAKKTSIGYFSLHDINSYPCEMGDDEKVRNASVCLENAHGQSIWNVHLQPWRTETEFWALYEDKYLVVLAKARAFLQNYSDRLRQSPTYPKPKAAVFLSAGFDACEWESSYMQRHKVNVPTSFYARFTHDVVRMAEEEDLGVGGRVISVLEGGYSDRALMSGVLSHMSALSSSQDFLHTPNHTNGFSTDLTQRLSSLGMNGKPLPDTVPIVNGVDSFDPNWWSLPCLEAIESILSPQATTAPPKKQRSDVKPTYTSATESYKAKIVSPPLGRRSLSGSIASNHAVPSAQRVPSPPLPDVDWATAAVELSKLLVPTYRETSSCKPEQLNAEASRARRDRQSGIGAAPEASSAQAVDTTRMQLREKRPKQQAPTEEALKKLPSRASRRRTVADVKLLNSDPVNSSPTAESAPDEILRKPMRRRSSVASTATSLNTDVDSEPTLASVAGGQKRQAPLEVKKTRPTASRTDLTNPKTTKRPAVAPRLPSGGSLSSTAEEPHANEPSRQGHDKTLLPVSEESQSQDVDNLASGMKKMNIKLNVPPKDEYEARQTKSRSAPKGRPPKASTNSSSKVKTSSPSKAKVKVTKISSAPAPDTNVTTIHSDPTQSLNNTMNDQLLPDQANDSNLSPDAAPLTLPAASSLPPRRTLDSASAPNLVNPRESLNEYPVKPTEQSRPSLPTVSPSSPPSVAQQPQTPPTVRRTKEDLPVFSSTSPIVFGSKVPPLGTGPIPDPGQPNTEATKTEPLAPLSTNRQIDSGFRPGVEDVRFSSVKASMAEQKESNQSIWDIPETPQTRKP